MYSLSPVAHTCCSPGRELTAAQCCLNSQTAVFTLLPEVPPQLYFLQWVLLSWQERQRKLLVCSLCRDSTGNDGVQLEL